MFHDVSFTVGQSNPIILGILEFTKGDFFWVDTPPEDVLQFGPLNFLTQVWLICCGTCETNVPFYSI